MSGELFSRIEKYSLWERLAGSERPILLYGTGNGGDKILDVCERYGITVSAVFASDGFVRDRYFRGMKVLGYSDVLRIYGEDITVLLAFGTALGEVVSFIRELDRRHELVIPDVPLYGGEIFDLSYLDRHIEALEEVYGALSDDMSRDMLADCVSFRLTGKLSYLERTENVSDSLCGIVAMRSPRYAVDGGAFRGDSTSLMLSSLPTLERVYACEADPGTFRKLEKYALNCEGRVIPVNCALSDDCGAAEYSSSSSRGSGSCGKNRRARTVTVVRNTVDRLICSGSLDFLKLDVEGDEDAALLGAAETIRRERPILSLSVYHRTDDIITLARRARELCGACSLYLRRPFCIPMWDLTLYAVPK